MRLHESHRRTVVTAHSAGVTWGLRLVVAYLGVAVVLLSLDVVAGGPGDLDTLLAMQPAAAVLGACIVACYQPGWGIVLSPLRPLPIFSLFYALYFPLPYLADLWMRGVSQDHLGEIGTLYALGYVSFCGGMWYTTRSTGAATEERQSLPSLRRHQVGALAAVVAVSLVVFAYDMVWRNAHGYFYTHGNGMMLGTSSTDSLISFAEGVPLPTILIAGLLAASVEGRAGRFLKYGLWMLGAVTTVTYVLASETRPAAMALLFTVMAAGLGRSPRISLPRAAVVLGTLLSVAALIQGIRIAAAPAYSSAGNQLGYSLVNTLPAGLQGLEGASGGVSADVAARASSGTFYLGQLIDATSDGQYLYGAGVTAALPGVVPRVAWPDKPVLGDPQVIDSRLLGIPVVDHALTPIGQFYAEGGTIGVVAGMLLYGALFGLIVRLAATSRSVYAWIVLAYVLSSVIQLELYAVIQFYLRGVTLSFRHRGRSRYPRRADA